MKASKLSVWNNKWNEVFDFTPNAKKKNYSIFTDISPNFVSTLQQMQSIIKNVENTRKVKIENLKDIKDEDLDLIQLDFEVEEQVDCIPFTLGALDKTFTHVITHQS